MAAVYAASSTSRHSTMPQSGDAESASRLATTAQSIGLYVAMLWIQDGTRSKAIMVEDRNVKGRMRKLAMPMRASWVRSSRASALEREANDALTSTAHATTTSRPASPPG